MGWGDAEGPVGPMVGAEPGGGAVRPGLDELWLSDQQVGEAQEQRQPLMILGQAAVAHPRFRGGRLLS